MQEQDGTRTSSVEKSFFSLIKLGQKANRSMDQPRPGYQDMKRPPGSGTEISPQGRGGWRKLTQRATRRRRRRGDCSPVASGSGGDGEERGRRRLWGVARESDHSGSLGGSGRFSRLFAGSTPQWAKAQFI